MEDKACDTAQLQEFIEECQLNSEMGDDEAPLGHSSPIIPPIQPHTPGFNQPSIPSNIRGAQRDAMKPIKHVNILDDNDKLEGYDQEDRANDQPNNQPNIQESNQAIKTSTSLNDQPNTQSINQPSITSPIPPSDTTTSNPNVIPPPSNLSNPPSRKTSRSAKSAKSSAKSGSRRRDSKDTISSDMTNFSEEMQEHKNEMRQGSDKKGRGLSLMQSPDRDNEGLKMLDCSSQGMTSIPAHIVSDKKIGTLIATANNLRTIPADIRKMKKLYHLDLSKNAIKCVNDHDFTSLPESMKNLTNLTYLKLSECNLAYVPAVIWSLISLEHLDLSRNKIGVLLPEIGNLRNLRKLNLQQTNITALPQEIVFCQYLEEIQLFGNNMESLPDTLPELPFLRVLTVNYRSFSSVVDPYMDNLLKKGQIRSEFIPIVVFEMPMIESLDLEATKINCLPEMFTSELTDLCISDNYIQSFPETLFHIYNLSVLDISKNFITKLPDDIGTMKNLTVFKANRNGFGVIPESIGKMERLEELEMKCNKIRSIPKTIKNMTNLKSLSLDKNYIQELPHEICTLMNLETLDMSENCLRYLPLDMFQLEKMTIAHSYRGYRKCGLWLYKNNLIEPPADIWKTTKTNKIFKYLKQLKVRKMENVNRQKLFMFGDTGAGKTSLLHCMVNGKTEFWNLETKLLRYTSWTTSNKVKLLVMDFSGNDSYKPALPLFLDTNQLVMIVFNHTLYTDATYHELIGKWVELVLAYMPGSFIKLVASHGDLEPEKLDERLTDVMNKTREHLDEYEKLIGNTLQKVCGDLEKLAEVDKSDVSARQSKSELKQQEKRLQFLLSNIPDIIDGICVISSVNGNQKSIVGLITEIENIVINEDNFPNAREKIPRYHETVSSALKHQSSLCVKRTSVKDLLEPLKITEKEITACLDYLHKTGEIICLKIESDDLILPKPRGLVEIIWSLYRSDIRGFLDYDDNRLFSCRGYMTKEEFDIAKDKFLSLGLISWPLLKCIWFRYKITKREIKHYITILCKLNLCFEIPQPSFPQGKNFSFPILAIAYFNQDKYTTDADCLEPPFNAHLAKSVTITYQFPRRFDNHIFESIAAFLQNHVTERFDWSGRIEALANDTKIIVMKNSSKCDSDSLSLTVQGEEIDDIHKTLKMLNPDILQMVTLIPGLVWDIQKTTKNCSDLEFNKCFPKDIFYV